MSHVFLHFSDCSPVVHTRLPMIRITVFLELREHVSFLPSSRRMVHELVPPARPVTQPSPIVAESPALTLQSVVSRSAHRACPSGLSPGSAPVPTDEPPLRYCRQERARGRAGICDPLDPATLATRHIGHNFLAPFAEP